MKIYLIVANDNYDYESSSWNCFFMSNKKEAKSLVKRLTDQMFELFRLAEEFKSKKDEKEDYVELYETAPGKRYVKFLRDNKIIKSKKYLPHRNISLSFEPIERQTK